MSKSAVKLYLISIGAVVAIGIMIVVSLQTSQNKAYTLEEIVNNAQSDVTVQEKRRVDSIYNLVDIVENYDEHEAATLIAVVEGRTPENNSNASIENASVTIQALTEAYPDLKSNTNYQTLMNELMITENLIAEYRTNYNKLVGEYNKYVRSFPTRLYLGILGYETISYERFNFEGLQDAPQNLFD